MPKRRRLAPPGHAYHVVNRGVERRQLFFSDADYRHFWGLLAHAKHRYPVKVFGVCLMPNHFHAIIHHDREGALSSYLGWVSGRYGEYVRRVTGTTGLGHVFQRRFWSGGIGERRHFMMTLRYVEANAQRSGLVARAEQWRWCSLAQRSAAENTLLDPVPYELPDSWTDVVNTPLPYDEVMDLTRPDVGGRRAPKPAGERTPYDD